MQSTRDESTKLPVPPKSRCPIWEPCPPQCKHTYTHSCKQIQTKGYLQPLPLFRFRTHPSSSFHAIQIIPQNAIDIHVPSFCKLIMHIIQLSKEKRPQGE